MSRKYLVNAHMNLRVLPALKRASTVMCTVSTYFDMSRPFFMKAFITLVLSTYYPFLPLAFMEVVLKQKLT